ncbi:glycosyl hydrolase family 65 central catalytic domain containing protein [Acanthamoeba castellanii str. Neff]|uniref:Protein-glucosylgalactosylhydroxylysine glucosidase n=1 Tax=Acanthamoeba castellanii (strain ATCC 30010 / Neff) TaxID=1257118 RepID=L8H5C3_ACACF|nr:glycosyl hydrolase family 65 central catalytic domain containing protein [Acanthamoeba castellanii str. Neff]ELR20704.1 glycosyl hydrolase family 65 central catalytic domain containing protein [Acanthamoeba castellanii str. Neff]
MKGPRSQVALAALLFVAVSLVALTRAAAPSPPLGIPADWVGPWKQGDLLFGTDEPQQTYRQAVVGNGYMATVVGSPDIYVSGVFNGEESLSKRARLPATNAITVTNALHTGSALNIREGVFYRRSYFKPCIACAEADIEQRWYAHRFYPSLLVRTTVSPTNESITLTLANNNGTATTDLDLSPYGAPPGLAVIAGPTRLLETPKQQPTFVAVATNNVPDSITVNATGSSTTFYFITAIRTNHDSEYPIDAALTDLQNAQFMQGSLRKHHIEEWEKIWEAGIEVGARFELGQAVNSSIYYLLSSIRAGDYETNSSRFGSAFRVKSYSVSPGSLATTGYSGHSFWDGETWMYPTMALFYPEVARNLLQYRSDRIPEASANAALNGFKVGLKFPWESGYTGSEVCPWPPGLFEHHLMGDIALAVQQYWRLTRDKQWLKEEGINLAVGIAAFWISHVEWNSTTQKYSINHVLGPDEYATGPDNKGINDNAYTNTIARISIEFAAEAMQILGLKVDPVWLNISSNIYVPFNATGNFHPEYVGYEYGQVVKQADTILMGYPALDQLPEQVRRNDLEYYEEVTDINGPAMSWGMFAIGWLEVGEYQLAAKYFNQSYQLNLNLPFNAWQETVNGGCPHFITGAGGFLQGLWAGFGGVRILNDRVVFKPVLPEHTTYLKYRQFHYLGSQIDIAFDDKQITFGLTSQGAQALAVTSSKGDKQILGAKSPVILPTASAPFYLSAYPQ